MRVLMQVPNYLPATRYGGPIRSCHGLARALVELGCEVRVVTSNVDGPNTIDQPLGVPVNIDGVSVQYFGLQTPKRIYYSPQMGAAFDAQAEWADVAHINGMFLWPGQRAARAAVKARIPLVVSPRGMLAPELIRGKSSLVKRGWILVLDRAMLRSASALHVTSRLEADGIRAQDLDLAPLVEIPNGVDVPEPQPSQVDQDRFWEGAARGQRVAFLARLDWKKGVEIAIEAVRSVRSAHLRLAGPDQIGLRATLEPAIAQAGDSDRIRFVGTLEDADKWAFLAGADLLIVPSLNENFGNTIIEALGVETPILCAPGVGAGEYARRIDPGCTVPREAAAFAEAIAARLADPSSLALIGREGRALVEDTLSWRSVGESFLGVFRDIAGGRARRTAML